MRRNTKSTLILAIITIALIAFMVVSLNGLLDKRGQRNELEDQIKKEQSQIENMQSENQKLQGEIDSMQSTIDFYNQSS